MQALCWLIFSKYCIQGLLFLAGHTFVSLFEFWLRWEVRHDCFLGCDAELDYLFVGGLQLV